MDKIIFILMAHLTGDYLFQTDYLAINKGKDNYILFAHSVLYTVGVMVVAKILGVDCNIYQLAILGLLHFPIDYIKSKGFAPNIMGDKNALIFDQIIHYLLLFILFK